jgi:hypothetical protein
LDLSCVIGYFGYHRKILATLPGWVVGLVSISVFGKGIRSSEDQ